MLHLYVYGRTAGVVLCPSVAERQLVHGVGSSNRRSPSDEGKSNRSTIIVDDNADIFLADIVQHYNICADVGTIFTYQSLLKRKACTGNMLNG